jgi:hypothetical protein
MTDSWARITMQEIGIFTAAVVGRIRVRGIDYGFSVQDMTGKEQSIAVLTADHLRELLPTLRPARIDLHCTDAERPALRALVDSIRQDRRVIEARH